MFTYNNLMPKITDKVKPQSTIREIERLHSVIPSCPEIVDFAGCSAKNNSSNLIGKQEKLNFVIIGKSGKQVSDLIAISVKVKMIGTVEAGFPSPAEEELVDNISFDDLLIQNREATFLLRVSGDSMTGAGIMQGDMVIVDKGLTPKSGDIVIAQVDGEWTMKFLRTRGDNVTLTPANPKYQPIKPKNELKIAGVVTAVVRKYK